jgi:hypothetical protein
MTTLIREAPAYTSGIAALIYYYLLERPAHEELDPRNRREFVERLALNRGQVRAQSAHVVNEE